MDSGGALGSKGTGKIMKPKAKPKAKQSGKGSRNAASSSVTDKAAKKREAVGREGSIVHDFRCLA
eukprot:125214-Pyramimonas_sp.AAC.1